MPKRFKMKKPRMIRIKGTKEKKEKDPNKIKQSVKINISTSGGGSGGATIPTIPNPIYNSMQGQKTGENVETHNLLKQIIQKQQQQPIIPAPIINEEPKYEMFDYNYMMPQLTPIPKTTFLLLKRLELFKIPSLRDPKNGIMPGDLSIV